VGATYWLEEQITDADVKKALKAAGGVKIDVLVSHDSPASAPNRITDTPEIQREAAQFFGYHNIQQSYLHREQLDKVFKAVKPTLVIHGHYHDFFNYNTKYGKVVCLDEGRSTLKRHIMFLTPEDLVSWKRS